MTSTKASVSIIAALAYDASRFFDIIKGDPSWDAIDHLACGLIDIANTILAVRDASDSGAPATDSNGPSGQPTQCKLGNLLNREVYEMPTWAFSCKKPSSIIPENLYIIVAMILGTCARNKLCNLPPQAFKIACALRFAN